MSDVLGVSREGSVVVATRRSRAGDRHREVKARGGYRSDGALRPAELGAGE